MTIISTDNITELKKYIDTFSSKEKIVYARIRFNAKHIMSGAIPLKNAVVLYSTDNKVFCLNTLVGYNGKEPQKVVNLLEYLEFDFDYDAILQPKQVVKVDIVKEGYVLEHAFRAYKFPKGCYDKFPLICKQDS